MELAGKYAPDFFPNQQRHQQIAAQATSPALRELALNTQYPSTKQEVKGTVQSLVNKLPKDLQKDFMSNWWILVDPQTVGVTNPSQEQLAYATQRVNQLADLAASV